MLVESPAGHEAFVAALHDAITASGGYTGEHIRAHVAAVFDAATGRDVDVVATAQSLGDVNPVMPDVFIDALNNARGISPACARVADACAAAAGALAWLRRDGAEPVSPGFRDGHANAYILRSRADDDVVIIGLSLLAPGVSYPLHRHPPAELYLVMSTGEWYNDVARWYTPGPGALVYHEPNVRHAMRAGDQPLLAFWCLRE